MCFASVKECALAYVCVSVCVCAGGTDSRLTLCWTLSMLWAGRVSEGSIENERGGLGSIRLPGRLSYCQMVRAGLIFGSQLLKLETVSVKQAGATGLRRRRSSDIRGAREAEFKSICILEKIFCKAENIWDHFNLLLLLHYLINIFYWKIYYLHTD